jgi:hypothetical protein
MNLFRYCGDDPVDRNDPMGLYAQGAGWSAEQWKLFDQAQLSAAKALEKAAAITEKALDSGKGLDAAKKAFEKAFGKGTATPENMAKVQQTMQKMAAALRDDGSKGYVANAMSAKEMTTRFKGTDGNTMAVGRTPGHEIFVNLDHRSFGKESALSWAVGHESAHNMGLEHGTLNGQIAYKYGNEAQRNAYKQLAPE